MAHHQFFGPGE